MWRKEDRLQGLADCELVQRYQATRDADCFREIYQRHWAPAFRIAIAILRQRSLAEDAVQTTFERALREIDGFSGRDDHCSLEKWLARICKNVCIDELRRQRTRRTFDPKLSGMGQHHPPTAGKNVQIREAYELLDSLEERYRICYLFEIEGYSYKEIGAMTGYSFDEVKSFIRTARRNLVKKFEGTGT